MQCCNKKMKILNRFYLLPVGSYTDRILTIFECTNCGFEKPMLQERNELTGDIIYDRGKPKKVANIPAWLASLNKQKSYFQDIVPQQGCKEKMAHIYGVTIKTPIGFVHQGFDFNGTKRKEFLSN